MGVNRMLFASSAVPDAGGPGALLRRRARYFPTTRESADGVQIHEANRTGEVTRVTRGSLRDEQIVAEVPSFDLEDVYPQTAVKVGPVQPMPVKRQCHIPGRCRVSLRFGRSLGGRLTSALPDGQGRLGTADKYL